VATANSIFLERKLLAEAKAAEFDSLKKLIQGWGRWQAQISTGVLSGGSTSPIREFYQPARTISGSTSFVPVVQSTNLGQGYHWSQFRSLDGPRLRRVLLQ